MRTAGEHQTKTGTKANQRSGSRRREATDLLGLDVLFLGEEIRSFVEESIKPTSREWWEGSIFPRELVPEMAALGLLGMHLEGYGCAGKSAVEYGLACMELEAGSDPSSIKTFARKDRSDWDLNGSKR